LLVRPPWRLESRAGRGRSSGAAPRPSTASEADRRPPHPRALVFHKKFGAARVDQACAIALEMGVYNFGFVRRYLERNLQPALSLRQVDPLIRQLNLYRDLIQEKIKSPNQETTE
jgi:hypothetical protein